MSVKKMEGVSLCHYARVPIKAEPRGHQHNSTAGMQSSSTSDSTPGWRMHRRTKSKATSAVKAKGRRGGRKRHDMPPSASSASSSGRRKRAAAKSAKKMKSRKRGRSSSSSTARNKRARRTAGGAAVPSSALKTSASCSSSASAGDEAATSSEGDKDEDTTSEDEDEDEDEDEEEGGEDEEEGKEAAESKDEDAEEEGNNAKENDEDDASNEDATGGALPLSGAAMQRYVVDTAAILGSQASNKTVKQSRPTWRSFFRRRGRLMVPSPCSWKPPCATRCARSSVLQNMQPKSCVTSKSYR
jgi:hypothetical protein